MVMRAHIIEKGKIVNTIVVESLSFSPGLISAENGGSIGDIWDGISFISPDPDPPTIDERFTALKTDFMTYMNSHYDLGTQGTIRDAYAHPLKPQSVKDNAIEVVDWANTVRKYYLEKKQLLRGGDVSTTWDFQQFDATKPIWDFEDFV